MNSRNKDSRKVSNQDRREFQTAENVSRPAGGANNTGIQPSETKHAETNTGNKTGDQGRTPATAEGSPVKPSKKICGSDDVLTSTLR